MQVVAAVLFDGPKVMLARRAPGKAHAGLWEFPGGKVEPGECPRAALLREMAEELALEVQVEELITVVRDSRIELSAYRVVIESGSPQLREHDQLIWRHPSDLDELALPELDRRVVLALSDLGRPARCSR